MNQVLQPPLSLASENPFSSEQECIDHIGAHAHHSSFAAGVPDPLRREGALGHSAAGIPLSSITSRYSAHRPDASYHSGAALSDTGSGSISASPSSSASSSLAFSSFAPTAANSLYSHHLPLASSFSYGYGNMSSATRRTSMMTDSASSAMLPPARSPAIGNPVSPSMGVSARDNYTTSTPGLHRHPHPHTLSPRHSDIGRYNPLPETPRSVLNATMAVPNTYANAGIMGYPPQSDRLSDSPPFNAQEIYHEITCEGASVSPNIEAKIEKGFFWSSDRVWTCYRRNYFAVNVSYGLSPWLPNSRLYVVQNGKPAEQIQSMAVSLAAAVDGTTGKSIELIQHTPKRDKGPQLPMKKELLAPAPPGKNHEHSSYGLSNFHQSAHVTGPQLPLQNDSEPSQPFSPASHANSNHQHAFERIQFKSATANNGKRRAQQQYYHLIVELWANVQNPRDHDARWIKIASKTSQHVVVRGRSPSHYHNEGPHNANNASRGTGSGGMGGPGPHGLGSNGGPTYTGGYRNGLSGNGTSNMSGGMYRGTTYSLDPSPVGSHSVSSASSLSGGPAEGLVGEQHFVDDEDTKMTEAHNHYAYYPAPIYETIPAKPESIGLPLPERRIKEEYPGPASMGTGWQVGGCGRFQGMDTSRGYYPDVHAHAHAGY